MSKLLISNYYRELENVIQYSGSKNESVIRTPFQNLLNSYCSAKGFLLIPELPYKQEKIKPDGTIKDALRLDWGYWESKDSKDNLDKEIEAKFEAGYPKDNILFEDSQTAVLYQKGKETMRVNMKDSDSLDSILNTFLSYVRPEVESFRKAIESFTEDLPTILDTLRKLITQQGKENKDFVNARNKLLSLCQESINPSITREDIREMIIQHILTEDIFLNIFNEVQFHNENNIAQEIKAVVNTFLKGTTKRNLLSSIDSYYQVIRREASNIYDHNEKQTFLKEVYESFYKAYNPLGADRLGIVYTPNEIVKFMVESSNYLLHKHFNKLLEDKDVEILDPATGTGTFITEIINFLPKHQLEYKYKNEVHCNEVAILPYYIANLNIEYTYYQKMNKYEEFNNICFVDTLDHTSFEGKQMDLFAMSTENTERIKRQNDKKISVIIGNPPYNAKQENFNDNNANRSYDSIDKRIKATYIKQGKAQNKNIVYDMYTRFYRWATDRLNENGIICFISNSSFLDALAFDGFRKCIETEFDYAYFLDLGGNVRQISGKDGIFIGEKHTIFGLSAMTGICISFLIKSKQKNDKCKIFYCHPFDIRELRDIKLSYLASNKFQDINFNHIQPNLKNDWINIPDNDFDDLLPLINKNNDQKILFYFYSQGIFTNRDEWVYDFDKNNLIKKIIFFIEKYNLSIDKDDINYEIKWTSSLVNYFNRKIKVHFDKKLILSSLYRPFTKVYHYTEKLLNHRLTNNHYTLFSKSLNQYNLIIGIMGQATEKKFSVLTANLICDANAISPASGGIKCLALYTYDKEGNRQENITDWGLQQFREYYQDKIKNNQPLVEQASSLLNSQNKELLNSNNKNNLSKSTNKNKTLHRHLACATEINIDTDNKLITKEDIFYYV